MLWSGPKRDGPEDLDWDLSCSLTVLQMEPAAGMEPSVTHVDVDSPRDGTAVLSVFGGPHSSFFCFSSTLFLLLFCLLLTFFLLLVVDISSSACCRHLNLAVLRCR